MVLEEALEEVGSAVVGSSCVSQLTNGRSETSTWTLLGLPTRTLCLSMLSTWSSAPSANLMIDLPPSTLLYVFYSPFGIRLCIS